jgi:acyl-CoA synthetase (AMP-forming)/AMP-acid ligase II
MRGLMMDFPLTIPTILRRAESFFGHKLVVTRLPDRSIMRRPYADVIDRAKRLAVALADLGVRPGDRVATLGWNTQHHLEAYLAIPSVGAVLHTLNLRLHCDDISYIVNDAEDQVLLLDASTLPIYEQFKSRVRIRKAIVMAAAPGNHGPDLLDYETLVAAADPGRYAEPRLDEQDAAAMCYTSGTTGRPKGVLYSHRALMLHTLAQMSRDCLGVSETDVVLPVVPMFHVNAWGLPFTCTMTGAVQVFPGPFLDPDSLLELLVSERVTVTAGVPTVWMGLLQALDKAPGKHDLSRLRAIVCGGSAASPALIRGLQERHGLTLLHAWGMTEMTPLGTVCIVPSYLEEAPFDEQLKYRARQGVPQSLVEIRARTDSGFAPWDGQTMGELEVRGPWVAASYYNSQGADDRFTQDGWFRTGDIVTIGERGCIELTDRAKDLVKSGGEWISTVALETALMGHPAVAEAAVIAVPHPKWDERPLAVVVLKQGQTATADDLRAFLAPGFAKWWLPDAIEFAQEIPRTSVGKFKKTTLRDKYRDRYQAV